MELIKIITDSDIVGGEPELLDSVSRYSARGIVVDEQGNVAMMYMSKLKLYKLPGGGIEDGEQAQDAFLREIMEETGYEAEIFHELGYIEEHKKRNDFMQYSYCYAAKANHSPRSAMLSENEQQLGMTVTWMTLDKALEVMNDSLHSNDYSTGFMILRDTTILETYQSTMNSNEKA